MTCYGLRCCIKDSLHNTQPIQSFIAVDVFGATYICLLKCLIRHSPKHDWISDRLACLQTYIIVYDYLRILIGRNWCCIVQRGTRGGPKGGWGFFATEVSESILRQRAGKGSLCQRWVRVFAPKGDWGQFEAEVSYAILGKRTGEGNLCQRGKRVFCATGRVRAFAPKVSEGILH
jgi:hypothetical protein